MAPLLVLAASLTLTLLTAPASNAAAAVDEMVYRHEAPAFQVNLPSEDWELTDQSAGGAAVLVFSPDANFSTRCSVLALPSVFMTNGIETREGQMMNALGDAYEKVSLEEARAFGRDVVRWEYRVPRATTVEWGFKDDETYVIFQVSAPSTTWAEESGKESLDRLRDSFQWFGRGDKAATSPLDETDPESIRVTRREGLPEPGSRKVEVLSHTIRVRIDPDERSLVCHDRMEVRLPAGTSDFTLHTSHVQVDDVRSGTPISWAMSEEMAEESPGSFVVTLTDPGEGESSLVLEVSTSSSDYFEGVDQNLVVEISVVGQVRPKSSWSSHVAWYPIDLFNDATVDITFDVPEGIVAVTGGEAKETTHADGRSTFRYVTSNRVPRQLPFGFAAAEYVSQKTTSEGGLRLEVYGYPGEERLIAQRVSALKACAETFEAAFGNLPWQDVRLAHVVPEEKETGVSLPGLILVSDLYFPDLETLDASSGDLSDPDVLGLLVVADELSHQWNFYSTNFPNELSEGLSTYTNALYLERAYGEETYRKTIAYCKQGWLSTADGEMEYAIANPQVYSSTRYRSVVFCKTPVVLDALRRKLGDEVFFAGFRRAFALGDHLVDGFERFEQGFSEAAGESLRPFFEQWFFRAGAPSVEIEAEATDDGVSITIRQTQESDPYDLDFDLEVRCANGERVVVPVSFGEEELTKSVVLPAAFESLEVRNAEVLPLTRIGPPVRSKN